MDKRAVSKKTWSLVARMRLGLLLLFIPVLVLGGIYYLHMERSLQRTDLFDPHTSRRTFRIAGVPDIDIFFLPELNHLLQTATTGALGEYYDIEETIAPLALDTITPWLVERGFGERKR